MKFRIVCADFVRNLLEAAWICTRKSFKFNKHNACLVLPRLKSRVRIPFPAPSQIHKSKQLSKSTPRERAPPNGPVSIFYADYMQIFESAQVSRVALDPVRKPTTALHGRHNPASRSLTKWRMRLL